jgi:hypothetical protein
MSNRLAAAAAMSGDGCAFSAEATAAAKDYDLVRSRFLPAQSAFISSPAVPVALKADELAATISASWQQAELEGIEHDCALRLSSICNILKGTPADPGAVEEIRKALDDLPEVASSQTAGMG